jgi:hypothetical protein
LIGLFWVIGWIIGRSAVMIQGFPPNLLPLPQRLLFGYGQLAIPLFGVVAAATWVLSDVYFRGRWIQWFLFALFACVIVVIFVVMTAPIFEMGGLYSGAVSWLPRGGGPGRFAGPVKGSSPES